MLAVSKTFPAEDVTSLLSLGQRDFGENYVQEAHGKISQLSGLPARFHLIGPLQRNKVKLALSLFDCIQSVGSLKLLDEIVRRLPERSRPEPLELMLQVRLGDEESKSGFEPDTVLDEVSRWYSALAHKPKLRIVGFMTIPMPGPTAEHSRPYFRRLRQICHQAQGLPWLSGQELSMGMSDDYPVAIEEGATWIRVGRALFGYRALKT